MSIRTEIDRYAKANRCPITHYEDLVCRCGSQHMHLHSDDDDAGAYVQCVRCKQQIDIANSREFIEDPIQNQCNCGHDVLSVGVGIALRSDTGARRWVYVGAHCAKCGETGVYVDWKEN